MFVPVTMTTWGVALLPLAVLLVLLLKWKWGVAKAAPVGLGIALLTGWCVFGGSAQLLAGEVAKGVWGAFSVLAVVVPAIMIFELTAEAQAFEAFRRGLRAFSPNELLQVLTVGWIFASFLQGVTGFGVPVAITAPLLVGMGLRPLWAVLVPLVGHAWATTFGTLAVAWEALVFQTHLSGPLLYDTALWAGLFTWFADLNAGLCLCWFYAGREGLKKGLPAVLALSLLHGGGQLALTQYNQVLCNFIVSSAALGLAWMLGKSRWYCSPYRYEASPLMARNNLSRAQTENSAPSPHAPEQPAPHSGNAPPLTLHQAFVPYYALTGITLGVLLVEPVREVLSFWQLGFAFPETVTAYGFLNPAVALYAPVTVFTHAGFFLFVSFAIGFGYFHHLGVFLPGAGWRVLRRTAGKVTPAALAVIALIAMSRVMGGTGQVLVLAQGTAQVTGAQYALFAPFVGVLGAFMTSSTMASNILFGSFQQTMADLLHVSPAVLLGAQTGGGSVGSMFCPGNVLLGTTTAGIMGREGAVMQKLFPLGLGITLFCGLVAWLAQSWAC